MGLAGFVRDGDSWQAIGQTPLTFYVLAGYLDAEGHALDRASWRV